MTKPKAPCILYAGTFPPRECGIATFTQDLTNAIDKEFNPAVKSKILAINASETSIYNYPRKVLLEINESDIVDYLNQANEINRHPEIKLINIQHEFGIFGGDWGNYLLPFMEVVKKPIITTFHTVLPRPNKIVKKITRAVTEKSARVIVMTKTAARLLENQYGINNNKLVIIPHGVHHVPFPSKSQAKNKLKLSGHIVLSTFGMLNRDKGLEYSIAALPEIVKEYPNVLYLIIGATHPNVIRQEGEKYRNKLSRLIVKLGIKDYVKFYNKYLSLNELLDYLKATDIYISPTLNPKQAVSGTLSYALSCACPVISTANQYARDIISPERGVLVRFRNAEDIKNALKGMLNDKPMTREMKKNSYFYSRHMTWQNVALSYFKTFNDFAKIIPREKDKFPPINLDHVKKLTDNFGLIQFAIHTKPDVHSGYCLDDNARALLVCAKHNEIKPLKSVRELMEIYLKFIKFTQKTDGKFSNFVSQARKVLPAGESEDSFGRAIWALGYLISRENIDERTRNRAEHIYNRAIKQVATLKSPRSIAFAILGLAYISAGKNQTREINLIKKLADKLMRKYDRTLKNSNQRWQWFEDSLTYSNYKIPESLLRAYNIIKNKEYLRVAEESIKFLLNITFEKNDYFSPIGQDGWYFKDGKRAYFDQQPEDAASATECLAEAYQTTKKQKYRDRAMFAFNWFLGRNHLNQMVYDEATGGCYDGIGKHSINFNQGAESTICYLLARLAVEKLR